MKALIWIGNFLVITLLDIILIILTGFKLGYGLSFLAYIVLPRFWYQKYEYHLLKKHMNAITPDATAHGMSPAGYLLKDVPQSVIDMCEHYRDIDNPKELKVFLNTCKESNKISKYAYIYLLRKYKK